MRFSFIIPIYNAEKYLDRCLNSIVSQDYGDYEILLVNDGSTDSSEQICLRYMGEYRNIHYYFQTNAGPSKARNRGMMQAEGEYLIFLDADDEMKPGSLKRMDDIIAKCAPDAVISHLIYYYVEENRSASEPILLDPKEINSGKERAFREMAKKRFSTPASKIVIKRSIVADNQIVFPTDCMVGEDICMTAQALCKCDSFCYVEPFYMYTQNRTSITHCISYEKISKTMGVCEKLYQTAQGLPQYKQQYLFTQISMILINFLQYRRIFTAEQKKEIRIWMQNHREILDAAANVHTITNLAGKVLGSGNAFLLAGNVVHFVGK